MIRLELKKVQAKILSLVLLLLVPATLVAKGAQVTTTRFIDHNSCSEPPENNSCQITNGLYHLVFTPSGFLHERADVVQVREFYENGELVSSVTRDTNIVRHWYLNPQTIRNGHALEVYISEDGCTLVSHITFANQEIRHESQIDSCEPVD